MLRIASFPWGEGYDEGLYPAREARTLTLSRRDRGLLRDSF